MIARRNSLIGRDEEVQAEEEQEEPEPADDTEYAREHIDSKALAEERERKEAHGIHMG